MIFFQPDENKGFAIEPSSSSWKIMYVVDQILKNDQIDQLDLPSQLLATLEARKIFTTQELLQSLGMEYPNELRGEVDWITDPDELLLLNALRKWDAERNIYPE